MKKTFITFKVEYNRKSQRELEDVIAEYLFSNNETMLPSGISTVILLKQSETITVPKRDWNSLTYKKKKAMIVEKEDPIESRVTEYDPYEKNLFRREFNLECPKCKKKLKSRSGLALHKKRCKK